MFSVSNKKKLSNIACPPKNKSILFKAIVRCSYIFFPDCQYLELLFTSLNIICTLSIKYSSLKIVSPILMLVTIQNVHYVSQIRHPKKCKKCKEIANNPDFCELHKCRHFGRFSQPRLLL